MYALIRRYNGVKDPEEAGRRVEDQFFDILRDGSWIRSFYWSMREMGNCSHLGLSR